MRRIVGVIFLVLLFAIIGVVSLTAGRIERRMGVALEDLAVLDLADPQTEYASLQQDLQKLPWTNDALKEIRARRATIQYWQRDYTNLLELAQKPDSGENEDPELQLLAANASFRTTQRGPQDKVTLLKNLDTTIRAYAEALRAGADRPDAAYNYELAVKLRDELAAGKLKGLGNGPTMADLPDDPPMHGDRGEPPKDMKVDKFEVRVPMDKDFKSKDSQTAGTGPQRRRKG